MKKILEFLNFVLVYIYIYIYIFKCNAVSRFIIRHFIGQVNMYVYINRRNFFKNNRIGESLLSSFLHIRVFLIVICDNCDKSAFCTAITYCTYRYR